MSSAAARRSPLAAVSPLPAACYLCKGTRLSLRFPARGLGAPGGPGVRIDSHLYSGYDVPPYYDSLLGKLVVWGPERETALARSRAALEEIVVEGVVTNLPLHRALLASPEFLEGRMTTNVLDRVGGAAFVAAARRS